MKLMLSNPSSINNVWCMGSCLRISRCRAPVRMDRGSQCAAPLTAFKVAKFTKAEEKLTSVSFIAPFPRAISILVIFEGRNIYWGIIWMRLTTLICKFRIPPPPASGSKAPFSVGRKVSKPMEAILYSVLVEIVPPESIGEPTYMHPDATPIFQVNRHSRILAGIPF